MDDERYLLSFIFSVMLPDYERFFFVCVSHPEIFGFQDVIKIKNKSENFLIILKFVNIYFSSQRI